LRSKLANHSSLFASVVSATKSGAGLLFRRLRGMRNQVLRSNTWIAKAFAPQYTVVQDALEIYAAACKQIEYEQQDSQAEQQVNETAADSRYQS